MTARFIAAQVRTEPDLNQRNRPVGGSRCSRLTQPEPFHADQAEEPLSQGQTVGEIDRLIGQIQKDGMTLVPLDIHFTRRGIAKVQLGIARGKRQYDKRETQKKRDWQRQKERLMREKG